MYYSRLQVKCSPDFTEILIAEVGEAGFDSFMETDAGFEAYVEQDKYDADLLHDIQSRYEELARVSFELDRIEKLNWNEEWEKNYHPIVVEDKCRIRAYFHEPDPNFAYELVITPKMSFGTGHHQTTYLMIKHQMQTDHRAKRVMDAGCGTTILSVMASKLGASEIEAFDIDEWSIVNGRENVEVNKCRNIHLQQGKITEVKLEGLFDIVLANINKNVLLSEMSLYVGYLVDRGVVILSGFYTSDIDDLLAECSRHGLREVSRSEKENWASLILQKV